MCLPKKEVQFLIMKFKCLLKFNFFQYCHFYLISICTKIKVRFVLLPLSEDLFLFLNIFHVLYTMLGSVRDMIQTKNIMFTWGDKIQAKIAKPVKIM